VSAGPGLTGAFAFGFALGAAPGPVQLLILSQTARRGLAGGLRVMLGANLTVLVILLALALGLSALEPSPALLRALHIVGGAFLVGIAALELRSLGCEVETLDAPAHADGWGPTAIGIVAVLLNPGAWLFFATTASAVLATAAADAGRTAAVATAVALTVGVSTSDLLFSVVGAGGRRVFGERGIRWIRTGLVAVLLLTGVAFVVQGAVASG
jgi:threonine/homoserine/homoserine lactone efflux protein